MIQWVYERTAAVVPDCWVATDDKRIADAVAGFGGRAVMTSAEHRSGTDRCQEACERIAAETGGTFDVVLNVQGDEPFVAREHLETLMSLFDSPDAEIGTLVRRFAPGDDVFNPNSPKVALSTAGDALYFSRSPIPHLRGADPREWSSLHTYYKHIGLYAYRTDVLARITRLPQGDLEKAESLEQLRWLENGYRIRVGEVENETVAVDTPEDLAKAASLLP